MISDERPVSRAWILSCDLLGAIHGRPLPIGSLSHGSMKNGWFVRLNNTNREIGAVQPFEVEVYWNGFAAGLIGPHCGTISNEDSFIAWLIENGANPEIK